MPALSLCLICIITHLHMYFCMSIVVIIKKSLKYLLLYEDWDIYAYEKNIKETLIFLNFSRSCNYFINRVKYVNLR